MLAAERLLEIEETFTNTLGGKKTVSRRSKLAWKK